MIDLLAEREKAEKAKKIFRKFLDRLKKHPPKGLDEMVIATDAQVFEKLDCLECANCCKTISPIFQNKDIERLADHFRISPGQFLEKHLRQDEDGDFVLLQSPCPFLLADNRCSVYDVRPKACREYPHTAQRKFHSRIEITKKNFLVCPAAFRVVENLEKQLRTDHSGK